MGHTWRSEASGGAKGSVLREQAQGGAGRGSPGLTSQDQVQELEGCLKARTGDAVLVGVQGQEGQAADEGQEAGPHGEAAGHVVAVEHAVELRRVRLVLVAVGQQGGEDDEGEDLWVQEGRFQGLERSSVSPQTHSSSSSVDRSC